MSHKLARTISLIISILGVVFFVTPLVNVITIFDTSFFGVSGGWLFLSWIIAIGFAAFFSARLHDDTGGDNS